MSDGFAKLRQGMEKKMEDLEQELERREKYIEDNMQLAAQESKTRFSELGQEMQKTKEDLRETNQVAEQVQEQVQQRATREEMVEQVQQLAQEFEAADQAREQVVEQVQQMATREELAKTREQLAEQLANKQEVQLGNRDLQQSLDDTRQALNETQRNLQQREREVQRLQGTVKGMQVLLITILGIVLAVFLLSPISPFCTADHTEHLMLTSVLPLTITMKDFAHHRDSEKEWYSEPFYTHFQGYKMCLNVDANGYGDGAGTHVSVFLYLMRGEFDDKLDWPFRGKVQIRLVSPYGENLLKIHDIRFNEVTSGINQRVFYGERARSGRGTQKYVSHGELGLYLDGKHKDSIKFEVALLEMPTDMRGALLLSKHNNIMLTNVLPLNISMGNVAAYNTSGFSWYSEPFYTHFHGYKMCVCVDANGRGDGAGSHVSFFVHLMRGEFDDQLSWPFHGVIQVRLLSLSGKLQKLHNIDFNGATDGVNERVLSKEVATIGRGHVKYVSHDELKSYLDKDSDSITFQVCLMEMPDDMYRPLSLSQHSSMWSMLTSILPLNISVPNFAAHQADDLQWFSEPFYTHFHGYKMCLRVDANGNGSGAGTYVSIAFSLMRGEFDDKLNWPFRGIIQIRILSLTGELQKLLVLDFNEAPYGLNEQVLSGERAPRSWGTSMYVSHNDLQSYLDKRKDSLTFQVALVELSDGMHGPLSISRKINYMWSNLTNILPLNISMTGFSICRLRNRMWYSEPFYAYYQGYKMCLRVDANGDGNGAGTHVSIAFSLMCGEFDDKLKWPFQGTIQIRLLSLTGELQKLLVLDFNEAPYGLNEQVLSGERAPRSWGTSMYVSHNDLQSYLDKPKDSLTFQVALVELSDGMHGPLSISRKINMWSNLTNILPLNISMTDFSKYRLKDWAWYSKPFYAHYQGYKMCLRVKANGHGDGAGTHVSVFLYLLRGEFDDQLNWPYQGTIQFSILSLEGEWKYLHNLGFKHATGNASERVVSGERATNGWGYLEYVPHDELESYLDKSQDSITFRLLQVKST